MGNREFGRILRSLDRMSPQQRGALTRMLRQMAHSAEDALGEPEECPHCESVEFVRWGHARGCQRWRCRDCSRTFTAATGTRAEGLRHRRAWPEFAAALMEGATLREMAKRCGIHRNTAHRWRQRFLEGLVAIQPEVAGIVEVDETYVLRSAKGQPAVRKAMGRPPRKRGGKARRRGLSREQVPILMAQDRAGRLVCQVSDTFGASKVELALEEVMAHDAILCSDGHTAYVKAALDLQVEHQRVNHSAGQRVRGPFHVQNVNGAHSAFKRWLRRFNGVSTARLPLYVAWFARITRDSRQLSSPNRVLELALHS